MWADSLTAGLDRNKTDKQPDAIFLELGKQLSPEQQFTQCKKCPWHEVRAIQLEDLMPTGDVSADALFHLNRAQAKMPIQRAHAGTRGPMWNLQFTGHQSMYKG